MSMSAEHSTKSKRPFGAERPFPWRCHHCGQDQVFPTTISYDAEVHHDGGLCFLTIPNLEIPICKACDEKVFTGKVDDQINTALRSYLGLLTPGKLAAALERVKLTQVEVAERLGIAESTLSHWLNETEIQSQAMDNLLRVFFAFPQVRGVLRGKSQDPQLGTSDLAGESQDFSSTPLTNRIT